jgi:hypothetical protein
MKSFMRVLCSDDPEGARGLVLISPRGNGGPRGKGPNWAPVPVPSPSPDPCPHHFLGPTTVRSLGPGPTGTCWF